MEKWAGGELRGALHLIAVPVVGGPYAVFEKKVKLIIWASSHTRKRWNVSQRDQASIWAISRF